MKGGDAMKRSMGILLLSGILFVLAADVFAAEILTNDTIVEMVKAGLGEELIISKIKISQGRYDLSTDGILKLKKGGVGERIIRAMVETSPAFLAAEAIQGEKDAIALYRQGSVAEAAAAFGKLIAEKPNDDGLKIWRALALLEQARGMKDSNVSGYKTLVVNAYAILQPLGRGQAANPDWNFAMAKAFWLNDRPSWAKRAAEKALGFRANFAEAQLLLGDLALALPDLPDDLRAEALYKMGMVSAELENKKGVAREWWERAASAAPASRYGRMAQQKLSGQTGK